VACLVEPRGLAFEKPVNRARPAREARWQTSRCDSRSESLGHLSPSPAWVRCSLAGVMSTDNPAGSHKSAPSRCSRPGTICTSQPSSWGQKRAAHSWPRQASRSPIDLSPRCRDETSSCLI
jgi:hypothetical protein